MIENRSAAAAPIALRRRATAALVAALLGAFVLYGVGFAQPMAVHNAAHDGRHSFAFPCH
jgi:cobalt transporter subunit CbtB